MIVTNLKKSIHSKSKTDVYIDYVCAFSLYDTDVKKLNLKISDEISQNKYDSLIESIVKKNALNDALRLISRMDYSVKMLSEKLFLKKYPCDVVSFVTCYLSEKKYLDDYEYADRFARSAFLLKKKGKAYVEAELLRRGISKDLIINLTDKYYNQDEIKSVAERKLQSLLKEDKKPDIKIYNKLRDYLLRQGFSFDEISSAIYELKGNYED